MELIKDVYVNDTIDDDAKVLITKCFNKGDNVTLENLKKDGFFKPKVNWSKILTVSEGIQ